MAKKATTPTTIQEIEDAIITEATAYFALMQKRLATETTYAFLLELSAVGYAIAAAIATEESLERFADECAEDFDDDIEAAKNSLRWGSTEDGWYQSEDKHFRSSNKLLDAAENLDLYPEYDGTLERIALQAIQRMIDQGVFGPAAEREKLVLGICHTGGDNDEKDFLAWAAQVNSTKVMKRLKSELKKR